MKSSKRADGQKRIKFSGPEWYAIKQIEYYKDLPKELKDYMKKYFREVLNGEYIKKKESIFNTIGIYENIKNNPERYEDFQVRLKEVNLKRRQKGLTLIKEGDYVHNYLQKEANREKKSLRKCTMNVDKNANDYIMNGLAQHFKGDFGAGTSLTFEEVLSYNYELYNHKNEETEDRELFLHCYNNRLLPLYVGGKLCDLLDNNPTTHGPKMREAICKHVKHWEKKELKYADVCEYLYKIHVILKICFPDKPEPVIVENIFDNIIYHKNKKKQTERNFK